MNDYWYLPYDLRQQADALIEMGFAYIYRADPEELLFSSGLTIVGDCYGWRFTKENSVVMDATIKDAVFSMCLEKKAYDDPEMRDLVSYPQKVFLKAKSVLKQVIRNQKAEKPKQLSLIA